MAPAPAIATMTFISVRLCRRIAKTAHGALLSQPSPCWRVCTGEVSLCMPAAPNRYHFSLPLSSFACDGGPGGLTLAQVTGLGLQNPNERNAYFCLDDIRLVPTAFQSDFSIEPDVMSFAAG